MWPSEATASRLYDIANIALIAALVVGVIATVLVVWMGNVKEGYLRRALADLGVEAGKANKEAAEAKLALERYKAPRILSAEQMATLSMRLKPFGKVAFDVATEQSNETASLLAQICEALEGAGWDWQDWKGGSVALKLPKQNRVAGMASVRGVKYRLPIPINHNWKNQQLNSSIPCLHSASQQNHVYILTKMRKRLDTRPDCCISSSARKARNEIGA